MNMQELAEAVTEDLTKEGLLARVTRNDNKEITLIEWDVTNHLRVKEIFFKHLEKNQFDETPISGWRLPGYDSE